MKVQSIFILVAVSMIASIDFVSATDPKNHLATNSTKHLDTNSTKHLATNSTKHLATNSTKHSAGNSTDHLKTSEYKPIEDDAVVDIDEKSTIMMITEEYEFGDDGVIVQHQTPEETETENKPVKKPSLMDISPATCSSQCYPGSFEPPQEKDCSVIINALLTNTTGSLEAKPSSWVYIYYKTCVAVLENPDADSPSLQLNWAILGKLVDGLKNTCLNSTSKEKTVGGTCIYDKYQGVEFSNVEVSLKRLARAEEEDQFEDPQFSNEKSTSSNKVPNLIGSVSENKENS